MQIEIYLETKLRRYPSEDERGAISFFTILIARTQNESEAAIQTCTR